MSSLIDETNQDQTPTFYKECLKMSNSSTVSQNEFSEQFHDICKKCGTAPDIKLSSKGKIKFICDCNESPRELKMDNDASDDSVYYYLYKSKEIDYENKPIKCYHDGEFNKYVSYCTQCKRNLCSICSKLCIEHQDKLIFFSLVEGILSKTKYIIKKINEKNTIETNIIKIREVENNDIQTNINNSINENEDSIEENYKILDDNNSINNDNDDQFINIKNEKNFEIYNKGEFNFINLFKIIIKGYQDFPNYNIIKTILSLEKFVNLYLLDTNKIKLNYRITEENIQYNIIKLFGKEFANNNKENCFLIINEKIMDLSHSIKLTDILYNISNNIPNEIDVYLIERKSKVMTDLSCMFKNISTITNKSDFYYDNYDSSNVISLSKMFYNCKSLEYLPDISKLKTKNVKDMSHMFYNCSSLKEFPDISLWNIENVIYMNSMFENCNTIASLPNISGWNIINTRFMNYMFKNCTSIPNLREALNWNINEEAFTFGMFEGIRLLEDEEILQNVNNCILTRLKNFMKMIYQYIKRIGLFNFIINILFYFFIIILINLISISSPFFSTYFSFNFNNIKEYIHFPTKYIEPSNYINLEYIASFNNITNITIIRENEKNYIDNLLNFTNINEGKTFEYHQGMNKFLNIIILIIFIFNIINFLYILIKGRFFIYTPKYYILISLFFLLALVLIILDILDFIIINKLLNSFYSFKERVDNIYEYKYIYNIILKEKNFFYFSLAALFINIVANFTLLLLGFDIWKIIFINRKSSNNQRNPLKSYN